MKSKLILWLLRQSLLNFDYHFLKESFHKKTIGLTVQSQAAFYHTVHTVQLRCSGSSDTGTAHRRRPTPAAPVFESPGVTMQCVWVQLNWARVEEIWHFEIVMCWFASLLPRFQYSFVNRFTKPELRISKSITNVYVFKRLSDFLVKILLWKMIIEIHGQK